MWEWAPEFKALVVFAEHRFYGQSLPFGNESYQSPHHLGYLTSEQALADYADLILHLKYTIPGAEKSAVVAFGGSYGGMLAAWFRVKYPHIVTASLAASAPINMSPGLAPCGKFNEAVTAAYERESELCSAAIRKSWTELQKLGYSVAGCKQLRRKFGLCQELHPSNYTLLRDWIKENYGTIALVNFPEPSDLVGAVPASPVRVVCEGFVKAPANNKSALVDAVVRAVNILFNSTGQRKCNDLFIYQRHIPGYSFQKCNELMTATCGNGVTDMFFPYTWNATAELERCQKQFTELTSLISAGDFLKSTKHLNTERSNGELDPWSVLGVLEPLSDDVVVLKIPGAAHHADLRFSRPSDPPEVVRARQIERTYIRRWIAEADESPERGRKEVDHFAFHNNKTFKLRYLMNDEYWDRDGGPIFIYTGNEDNIEGFAEATGALWEWAPEFGALVVFVEHRFFGKSLPFGNRSFESPEKLGYLTSDQALADYADLIIHLKYTLPGAEKSAVIAIGGSYGGLLAAWMRLKFPHLVDGALSSGGPFNMPPGLVPCSTYSEAVTNAYKSVSEQCVTAIRNSWPVMERLAYTEAGARHLQEKFKTCQPLHPSNYTLFRDMLRDTYGVVAMVNYPEESELEICKHFMNAPRTAHGLVDGAAAAMSMFTAAGKGLPCLDVFLYERNLASYQFLKCNELMQPFCGNGVSDMFYPYTWNATAERERCEKKFGITPDFYRTIMMYGGSKFSTATNIIFSNGELDPWSALGVLEPPNDDVVVIVIPGVAHHVDLRFASPSDSRAVKRARVVEKNYIRQWISQADARSQRKKNEPKELRVINMKNENSFFKAYRV
ncbi:hypothetical protein HPB51_004445 [Rhipicephalus microplus]|uniref:Prolylcarboxypeptidase n=1 Tax=Rhipicephalus microplus TaxID=6941 RepID=A0A9J6EM42_RHIMP|nr:hypothetical protein HPB51_004445 [Rhipicephalus microplus]